jgi:hypothetical protein
LIHLDFRKELKVLQFNLYLRFIALVAIGVYSMPPPNAVEVSLGQTLEKPRDVY